MPQSFISAMVLLAFVNEAVADELSLPAAPKSLVELSWSTTFATVIASRCGQFVLADENAAVLNEFMRNLERSGVDLSKAVESYSFPKFDGDSVKWLFARSNNVDRSAVGDDDFCDIAERVFVSDMLTATMLHRVDPLGNS